MMLEEYKIPQILQYRKNKSDVEWVKSLGDKSGGYSYIQ